MSVSKDYEKFNKSMLGDVSQASFSAQSLDKKLVHTKVRIRESCNPELIPNNSTLEIEQVPFHALKFGDIVLVREKKEIVIRRFLRFEVRGANEIILHLVNQMWHMEDECREGALTGRVLSVESKGETFNPYLKEPFKQRVKNWLTHFGTSNPWTRFVDKVSFISSITLRRKR